MCTALLGAEIFAAPWLQSCAACVVRGTHNSWGSGGFGGCLVPLLRGHEKMHQALGPELPSTWVCKIRDLVVEESLRDWLLLPPAKTFQTCALQSWLNATGPIFSQGTEQGLQESCSQCLWQYMCLLQTGMAVPLSHWLTAPLWQREGDSPWKAPPPRLPAYKHRDRKCWSWLSSAAQEHSHFSTSSTTCHGSVWVPDNLPWFLRATRNRR